MAGSVPCDSATQGTESLSKGQDVAMVEMAEPASHHHTGHVRALAVTRNGEEVVSAGDDGTVRIWNRDSGEQLAALKCHVGWVWALAVTPDGEEVVSAGDDRKVLVWNRDSGEQRAFFGHSGRITALAVTPDGEEVVSAGDDLKVRVWNRQTGAEHEGHTGNIKLVWALAVTPDGKEVVSAGDDGEVRIWNRVSGKQRLALIGHHDGVWALAVTPDGKEVVSAGDDGEVRIWNRRTGKACAGHAGHTGRIWALAVTPDGEEILSGGSDGTVLVWNRPSGQEPFALTTPTGLAGRRSVLDNESRERRLVGDVYSMVASAGQIAREFAVGDHGIDIEIEFKNDDGAATGKKLYLQLKSGDSHLRHRMYDDARLFRIRKPRHADYWANQMFPVMLVVRGSSGAIEWAEIREPLLRQRETGPWPPKEIRFFGVPFDVRSIRQWRDRALGLTS
ncbi:MAG: DUF4365 domain-containing protein [Acidimicrobiales bacterium]